MRSSRAIVLTSLLGGTILLVKLFAEDTLYRQPPKLVASALNAAPTPAVSVSPQHDYAIFLQTVRYPPIADVAQPMLRLAGIRIDSNTNGMHLAPSYTSYSIKRLADGADVKISPPPGAKLGPPVWSPDGKQFAFTNTSAHGIELWIASTATGQIRRMEGIVINGVQPAGAGARPVEWLADNRTLLVQLVPSGRGSPPAEETISRGPHVQESLGNAGPAPTFEDLLSTPHDEDFFDYYATSQLSYLDSTNGKATLLGKPAIYTQVRPSPDLKHILVAHLHKPYSYQLPARSFPDEIEVWDRAAKVEHKIASLPLAEHVPLDGVRTGPRSVEWLPEKPAMLTWVEALDGGNPKETVPNRDRILGLAAPFGGEPEEIFRVNQRFRSMQALASGKALVEDFDRKTRVVRTMEIDLDKPGAEARVVFSRNERDAYHDPGTPVSKITPDGRQITLQSGDEIYLSGQGSSPAGDEPFLDRYNLATGKSERLFQSSSGFESIVAVLDDKGTRLLTRRESPADPPNYFIRTSANRRLRPRP
jgi:dipeptidyl aminopeptidase/acylaminoacyl peptidase